MRAGARRIQLHGDARVENLPAAAEIRDRTREIARPRCRTRADNPAGRRSPARSPVRPPLASSAASTPLRAASPACSGFTIVPKFSLRPDADEAAIASACPVAAASRPSSRLAPRGRAEGAERRRAVPAALIVARIHQPAEARLDLEADDVRVEHRAAGRARDLAGREHRRHERRARMRERHEAHVVEVERVRGRAVGERRVRSRTRDGPCPRYDARAAPSRSGATSRARCAPPARQRPPARRRSCRGTRLAAAARAADGGSAGRDELAESRDRHERPVTPVRPAFRLRAAPMAAMKRCLMNTQSCGGFTVGARFVDPGHDHPRSGLARRARQRGIQFAPASRPSPSRAMPMRARRRFEIGAMRRRGSPGRRSSRTPGCP